MKQVLFINNKISNCGVYQYGKRTANILTESKHYDFEYLETDSQEQLISKISQIEPDICIFNYHHVTMNWLQPLDITQKKVALFHESVRPQFKNIISVNPKDVDSDTFSVIRPTFKFKKIDNIQNKKITIGSFGFGFEHKGFDKICKIVNEQFDEAVINLHITHNFYNNNQNFYQEIFDKIKTLITKPGIDLKITNEFLTDEEVLAFLSKNDINIFCYDPLPGRGPASVLDFAISVEKPIGLTRSHMFEHLEPYFDFFNLEKYSIKELLSISPPAVDILKQQWSNDNFILNYEKILETIEKN